LADANCAHVRVRVRARSRSRSRSRARAWLRQRVWVVMSLGRDESQEMLLYLVASAQHVLPSLPAKHLPLMCADWWFFAFAGWRNSDVSWKRWCIQL